MNARKGTGANTPWQKIQTLPNPQLPPDIERIWFHLSPPYNEYAQALVSLYANFFLRTLWKIP